MSDDSFRELVIARGPDLTRVATLLCRDRGEAEDLVQDTLASAYASWRRIRGRRFARGLRTTNAGQSPRVVVAPASRPGRATRRSPGLTHPGFNRGGSHHRRGTPHAARPPAAPTCRRRTPFLRRLLRLPDRRDARVQRRHRA